MRTDRGKSNITGDFMIPVVLFVFRRKDTLAKIFERIRLVQPRKMYILSDGPRNEEEKEDVKQVRAEIDRLIDWECDVNKNYAECNRGVFENIGLGAKWVLSKEENAIFLEDDNLPETTFFYYCEEMIKKYRTDNRILWICGTNYLINYRPEDGASYVFTKHLLPCGWATWANKFLEYYDGELDTFEDPIVQEKIKRQYENKALYHQQYFSIINEWKRKKRSEKFCSWDYQMAASIREHGLYGIAPCKNQIRNIGVDRFSTHGGTSMDNVMTRRFCELETVPMVFPLVHPKVVLPDAEFEKRTGEIILNPLSVRIPGEIIACIKFIFGIPRFERFTKENIKKYFWTRRRSF